MIFFYLYFDVYCVWYYNYESVCLYYPAINFIQFKIQQRLSWATASSNTKQNIEHSLSHTPQQSMKQNLRKVQWKIWKISFFFYLLHYESPLPPSLSKVKFCSPDLREYCSLLIFWKSTESREFRLSLSNPHAWWLLIWVCLCNII